MRALFRKRHEHKLEYFIRSVAYFFEWCWLISGEYILGGVAGILIMTAIYFNL